MSHEGRDKLHDIRLENDMEDRRVALGLYDHRWC